LDEKDILRYDDPYGRCWSFCLKSIKMSSNISKI